MKKFVQKLMIRLGYFLSLLIADLTAELTADTKYLSSFKIIFWYNIHFFYSWKLEFPCLIVSKVALSKIKVK